MMYFIFIVILCYSSLTLLNININIITNIQHYTVLYMYYTARQEKPRDPTARFDAFVQKTAATHGAPPLVDSCFGNTSTSGSFGGKPKIVRKGKKGKKVAPPAWLRKGGGDADEGN
jgi:hypothetical protein